MKRDSRTENSLVRIMGSRLGKQHRRALNLVSMSLHLLSISLRSEERILPRCTTVLEKPRGIPQKFILGSVDEPAA